MTQPQKFPTQACTVEYLNDSAVSIETDTHYGIVLGKHNVSMFLAWALQKRDKEILTRQNNSMRICRVDFCSLSGIMQEKKDEFKY